MSFRIIKDREPVKTKWGTARKYLCSDGRYYNQIEISERTGIPANTLHNRIKTMGALHPMLLCEHVEMGRKKKEGNPIQRHTKQRYELPSVGWLERKYLEG